MYIMTMSQHIPTQITTTPTSATLPQELLSLKSISSTSQPHSTEAAGLIILSGIHLGWIITAAMASLRGGMSASS